MMWSRIKQITATSLGWLSIGVFVILVVDVLLGVFSRKVLGDQYRWSEELARFLLVWISFLGGAIAYIDDKHLGVDLLVDRMHIDARRLSRIVTHGLVFAFALFVMGIGGTDLVLDRFDAAQMLPALQINKAWFYLAVPVSGYIIELFALGNVISLIGGAEDVSGHTADETEVPS
jgi:TRAP-type C4-dicarboxylate transport system permease small subunit